MRSVRVGLLRKESWGGDGKMVERDGSFCMRDQCLCSRWAKDV